MPETTELAAIARARNLIDGAYVLEAWHDGESVLQPPAATARFVLLDGIVMAILIRTVDGVRTAAAQYGSYELTASGFAYRYTDRVEVPAALPATASGDPDGIRFDEIRPFAVSFEGEGLRLKSSSEKEREFWFTSLGLTYSERGRVLRKWRRATCAG